MKKVTWTVGCNTWWAAWINRAAQHGKHNLISVLQLQLWNVIIRNDSKFKKKDQQNFINCDKELVKLFHIAHFTECMAVHLFLLCLDYSESPAHYFFRVGVDVFVPFASTETATWFHSSHLGVPINLQRLVTWMRSIIHHREHILYVLLFLLRLSQCWAMIQHRLLYGTTKKTKTTWCSLSRNNHFHHASSETFN